MFFFSSGLCVSTVLPSVYKARHCTSVLGEKRMLNSLFDQSRENVFFFVNHNFFLKLKIEERMKLCLLCPACHLCTERAWLHAALRSTSWNPENQNCHFECLLSTHSQMKQNWTRPWNLILKCQTSPFTTRSVLSCCLLSTFTVCIHLCPHLLFAVFLQQASREVEGQICDGCPPFVDDSRVHRHGPVLGQIRVLLLAWSGSASAQFPSVCSTVKSIRTNKQFSRVLGTFLFLAVCFLEQLSEQWWILSESLVYLIWLLVYKPALISFSPPFPSVSVLLSLWEWGNAAVIYKGGSS